MGQWIDFWTVAELAGHHHYKGLRSYSRLGAIGGLVIGIIVEKWRSEAPRRSS